MIRNNRLEEAPRFWTAGTPLKGIHHVLPTVVDVMRCNIWFSNVEPDIKLELLEGTVCDLLLLRSGGQCRMKLFPPRVPRKLVRRNPRVGFTLFLATGDLFLEATRRARVRV